MQVEPVTGNVWHLVASKRKGVTPRIGNALLLKRGLRESYLRGLRESYLRALSFRRATPLTPSSPVPNNNKVAGSGTA